MQSRTTRKFWRLFSDLPLEVQRDAKRAYRLFESNPSHPGLQFKKLEGEDNIDAARIGLDYRALAVMKKDRIGWCDSDVPSILVGSHHRRDHDDGGRAGVAPRDQAAAHFLHGDDGGFHGDGEENAAGSALELAGAHGGDDDEFVGAGVRIVRNYVQGSVQSAFDHSIGITASTAPSIVCIDVRGELAPQK